jgi:hypothetical protein
VGMGILFCSVLTFCKSNTPFKFMKSFDWKWDAGSCEGVQIRIDEMKTGLILLFLKKIEKYPI